MQYIALPRNRRGRPPLQESPISSFPVAELQQLLLHTKIMEKWFILHDSSFPPDTLIRLGQLITDPRKPTDSLQSAPLEIGPKETTIDHHEQNVTLQTHTDGSCDIGLSAAVLSLLPFGLAGYKTRNATYRYEIERVEGRMFLPSPEYVSRSVSQPEVLRYLARHRYRKSLYMIVGIRVGFNAEFTHQRKYERGGHLNGCIPGAVNGISLDVGGKFKLSGNDEIYERKSIPSTFVFAYRLREVRYFKKDNSTTDMEFTKGATLHDLDGSRYASVLPSVTDTSYLGNDDEIEIDGIAGEDFEEDEEDTVIVDGCIMVDSVTVSVR